MPAARKATGGRFRRGRSKTGGRRKGTPNRATKAWKEFVIELVNDPEQQQALAEAIKAHPELLFKAAEHAVGKPHQTLDQDLGGRLEISWQDDLADRIAAGRKRLAEVRADKENT